MLEDMTIIQKDFYRLEEWASTDVRELKTESHRPASAKAEPLVLVQMDRLGSSTAEKDLVDWRLSLL